VTRPAIATLRRLGLAALAFALIWLTLVRGPAGAAGLDAWVAGVLAVGAALWTLHRGAPPAGATLRWTHLPALVALFLWQSLAGGVDVARRVLSPRMPLQPGLVVLRLALPDEGARVLLALLVSLMPGTLAARLEGSTLTLHALDLRLPVEAETRRIERRIAGLYGLDDRCAAGR
jgi:multicomponent Na+:H+ antiporter subunit E